jgi:hypothetical protein
MMVASLAVARQETITMPDQTPLNGRAFPWHECTVPSAEKAVAFYQSVLGWGTHAMNMGEMGDYTMFTQDGEPF